MSQKVLGDSGTLKSRILQINCTGCLKSAHKVLDVQMQIHVTYMHLLYLFCLFLDFVQFNNIYIFVAQVLNKLLGLLYISQYSIAKVSQSVSYFFLLYGVKCLYSKQSAFNKSYQFPDTTKLKYKSFKTILLLNKQYVKHVFLIKSELRKCSHFFFFSVWCL